MATAISFVKTHWATLSALILAIAGVLLPEGSPAVERFLIVFASILGAFGLGAASARLAVHGEALRLGLLPLHRPR